MRTLTGSEVINQDRRQLLSTAAMGNCRGGRREPLSCVSGAGGHE